MGKWVNPYLASPGIPYGCQLLFQVFQILFQLPACGLWKQWRMAQKFANLHLHGRPRIQTLSHRIWPSYMLEWTLRPHTSHQKTSNTSHSAHCNNLSSFLRICFRKPPHFLFRLSSTWPRTISVFSFKMAFFFQSCFSKIGPNETHQSFNISKIPIYTWHICICIFSYMIKRQHH